MCSVPDPMGLDAAAALRDWLTRFDIDHPSEDALRDRGRAGAQRQGKAHLPTARLLRHAYRLGSKAQLAQLAAAPCRAPRQIREVLTQDPGGRIVKLESSTPPGLESTRVATAASSPLRQSLPPTVRCRSHRHHTGMRASAHDWAAREGAYSTKIKSHRGAWLGADPALPRREWPGLALPDELGLVLLVLRSRSGSDAIPAASPSVNPNRLASSCTAMGW